MVPRPPVIEVMDDAVADILREKTEYERLQIVVGMWRSARVVLRAAIRTEHPDWTVQQVNREIANRLSRGESEWAIAEMERNAMERRRQLLGA